MEVLLITFVGVFRLLISSILAAPPATFTISPILLVIPSDIYGRTVT